MESQQWTPDIVIGIDFGMTCTGVAYSTGPDWHDPKVIQSWPGLSGCELRNKVQSALSYRPGTNSVDSWGFLTDVETHGPDTHSLFKLYLDPSFEDDSGHSMTAAEARSCFRDYLRCVRKYVEQTLEESIPHFEEKYIEYSFSTPTTWTSPAMISQIEKAVKEAGFEDRYRRKVKMGLTEAEAAAVHASKSNHRQGEVILVVDAGGGTTDVNILKVKETERRHTALDQLVCVEGKAFGSALIDWKVRQLIRKKLEAVNNHLSKDPEDCVQEMIQQRFETFKCSFGQAGSNIPSLPMRIPGLEAGFDMPEANVFDSKLHLTKEELQGIFDQQVDGMFDLIMEQIGVLQHTHPTEQINYLVLSGGLGSSAYVKSRLRSRCDLELESRYPSADGMRFLMVQNPQTAVVLGLVSDRIQELDSGVRVFKERRARNSYGIICRELYKPLEHMSEDVSKDPRDGRKWAEGQIVWLIKKGETVSTERHIEHNFKLKINPGNENTPWRTDLVESDRPRDQLPRSLKRPGAKILCNIISSIESSDMKKKNRHWYNSKPEYWRAEFTLRVIINPADLKFHLWNKREQRISRDHDEITVRWDPPQKEASLPDTLDSTCVYRD